MVPTRRKAQGRQSLGFTSAREGRNGLGSHQTILPAVPERRPEAVSRRHVGGRLAAAKALGQGHRVGARFDFGEALRHSGLGAALDASPAEVVAADALLASLPPGRQTTVLAMGWISTIFGASRSPQTSESSRRALRETLDLIPTLPKEAAIAFAAVNGICSLRLQADVDWLLLRRGIVELTRLPHLQRQLAQYGRGGGGGRSIYNLLAGSFAQLPLRGPAQIDNGAISASDAVRALVELAHLEATVDSAADLAAGRLLHDAGQLLLHYRRANTQAGAELCLSFRHADGVTTFFPDPDGGHTLATSAVRSMRTFVRSYSGPPMSGELSPHSKAERLARLVGLAVKGRRGHLLPAGSQGVSA